VQWKTTKRRGARKEADIETKAMESGNPFSSERNQLPGTLSRLVEMTINIEWQDQFGRWNHYLTKQNQVDAYRVAQRRAESTGKRYRLVDAQGRLLDLLDP